MERRRYQWGSFYTIHLFGVLDEANINIFFFADKYTELCTIEADLSRVPKHSRPKTSGKGNFYRVDYDIILLFGMTELNAQIAWKEKVSGRSIKRISD